MSCVLILEDDDISARLAARMLRMSGHEVHTAARSTEAWQRLHESAVDMMFLDTELDGEHGWEFLARIRGDIVFKELPVIVYSSVARRDVVQRYLTLGVQGILVKPATAERLSQEAERVTRISWRKKLFEPEDAVHARTGLLSTELTRLYREAAAEVQAAFSELSGLAEDPTHAAGLARLNALKSCALNIGYLRLVQIIEQAQKAADASDSARVKDLLERLPAALHLLHMHAGVEESADEVPNPAGANPAPPPPAAAASESPANGETASVGAE